MAERWTMQRRLEHTRNLLLDAAESFFGVSLRSVRKVPTLRGKTVITFADEPLDLLAPLPADVTFSTNVISGAGFVHLFALARTDLVAALERIRPLLATDGMIWVSWPKKASKVPTDITEDTIRAVALPMGLVDVKVCAVDATWSGLKLVIRKALR